jgi:hypothetical protein
MGLLELLLVIILIAWLGGWGFHIGGDLIHILLVVFVIVLIYRLLKGNI